MNYCPTCGTHTVDFKYPYTCIACSQTFWKNPVPVTLVVQPVETKDDKYGVIVVRRTIEPGIGELCLPCGYMDADENWRESAIREFFEETNIALDPDSLYLKDVTSENGLLVFNVFSSKALNESKLPEFTKNAECSERIVITEPINLAFDNQTKILNEVFDTLQSIKNYELTGSV